MYYLINECGAERERERERVEVVMVICAHLFPTLKSIADQFACRNGACSDHRFHRLSDGRHAYGVNGATTERREWSAELYPSSETCDGSIGISQCEHFSKRNVLEFLQIGHDCVGSDSVVGLTFVFDTSQDVLGNYPRLLHCYLSCSRIGCVANCTAVSQSENIRITRRLQSFLGKNAPEIIFGQVETFHEVRLFCARGKQHKVSRDVFRFSRTIHHHQTIFLHTLNGSIVTHHDATFR
mmetsp:Transcript_17650/g.29570  ORF Transcript_17650/g.29570 Transcript_17650/m.29570 type:complete len:239 (-) Transcript_17650:896-1612(-)